MRALAAFVMGGWLSAVLVVAGMTVLALLLPPLTSPLAYAGGGGLALVTLRRGPGAGAGVLAGAAVLLGLASQVLTGSMVPGLAAGLVLWVPVWLAAGVLRTTIAWPLTLLAVVAMGIALIALMHLALGDPAGWWAARMKALVEQLPEQGMALAEVIPALSRWMTAVMAAALAVGVVASLLLGRWWQSLLYNPGGFGREFRALQMGRGYGLVLLLLVVAGALLGGTPGRLSADLALVAAVPLLFQGIAVVHGIVVARGMHRGWLIALYVLLLVAEPHAAMLVTLLGWLDTGLRFRERLPGTAS